MSSLEPIARPTPRWFWLDTFRGAAVILMIETHVANTFLAAEPRDTAWFTALTYLNGLVAPSFLFIAGFVQGAGWRAGTGKPIPFLRRLRRLGWIAGIGYGLHFPFPQLWKRDWSEAIHLGTQVDVLPCLAVSLLILLTVSWAAQRLPEGWRNGVWWSILGALALAVIMVSPVLVGWRGGPIPLRAFVNTSTGSLFPLFSWAAFVFCGALCGAMVSFPLFVRLSAMAAVMVLGQAIPSVVFSAFSPEFFFERLGWVMGLALLCEWLVGEHPPEWIAMAGRESLLMYVVHLTLIFSLADAGVLPKMDMSPGEILGWTLVVLGATFAVALVKVKWQAASTKLATA